MGLDPPRAGALELAAPIARGADVTEKKSPKKAPAKEPEKPPTPAPDALKVLGPGVMKRPKRDPSAAPVGADEVRYTPSEQVFRRRG